MSGRNMQYCHLKKIDMRHLGTPNKDHITELFSDCLKVVFFLTLLHSRTSDCVYEMRGLFVAVILLYCAASLG